MKGFKAVEEEEAPEVNPQDLLEKGKMLCQVGQEIMAAASAMGAVDAVEEEAPEEEMVPEEESEEYESEPAAPAMDPKKNALIIAIKKKLGR